MDTYNIMLKILMADDVNEFKNTIKRYDDSIIIETIKKSAYRCFYHILTTCINTPRIETIIYIFKHADSLSYILLLLELYNESILENINYILEQSDNAISDSKRTFIYLYISLIENGIDYRDAIKYARYYDYGDYVFK